MTQFSRFSPKQMKVLTWWAHPETAGRYDAIIADGAVRSGKTLSMSVSFTLWAMQTFEGESFAICGKTVESCKRNVITPLIAAMGPLVSFRQIQSKNYIEVEYQGNRNRFYIFGGKDEGSAALIQGITLAGILLDEVALMPRSFVEQALARCSVTGSRFWFNCNPENPYHWFYKEWVLESGAKKAMYLHFTMEDNPTLSPEVKERYESLYSGVFYDRFIRGRWVAAEGLVYPMFSEAYHVVRAKELPFERFYISCDYGTLNPMSMGLWGVADGVWYRIREYYHSGRDTHRQKTDEEYYDALEALAGERRIESVVIDPSAASFIACVRKHGRFRVQKAQNDVLGGIAHVAEHLRKGDLRFFDCCRDCIREFSLYRWDEKAREDRPIKESDHAMDEVRYLVNTIIDRKPALRVLTPKGGENGVRDN